MALLLHPLVVLLVATVAWAVPKGASVGNICAAQLQITLPVRCLEWIIQGFESAVNET